MLSPFGYMEECFIETEILKGGAGKMGQWFRVPVLAEDVNSIPSTHLMAQNNL